MFLPVRLRAAKYAKIILSAAKKNSAANVVLQPVKEDPAKTNKCHVSKIVTVPVKLKE